MQLVRHEARCLKYCLWCVLWLYVYSPIGMNVLFVLLMFDSLMGTLDLVAIVISLFVCDRALFMEADGTGYAAPFTMPKLT